jgi:thiol-disulfide isomerase/thioredoxin
MRKFYPLFFLFFLSTHVKSQTPASVLALEDPGFNQVYYNSTIPKISGKLINISKEELKKLSISYAIVTPFAEWQVKKTAHVKKDGSFSLNLDYAFPYQQIFLGIGELFYAGLYANKGLYVELDIKKIKEAKEVHFNGNGVRYLGPDGSLNVYLNNFVLYRRSEQQQFSREMNLIRPSDSPVAAFSEYNKLYDSIKRIQESYIAINPSPYSWILENERLSDYYGKILVTYRGKVLDDSLWQKIKQHKAYLISNDGALFYTYLRYYISFLPGGVIRPTWKDVAEDSGLDASEKLLIDSLKNSETMQPAFPYTQENINKWTSQLKTRIQKIAFARALHQNVHRIDSLFPANKADFLKLGLSITTDLNEQKTVLDYVARSMHTPWCSAVLKKEYGHTVREIDEINKALAKSTGGEQHSSFGKPLFQTSFGAIMYKASGIKALDFLMKLKQSFPGKAIIIDRWATWCGPCLADMPHSKELEEESKNLPVVFVYLCTINSSSESKWKSKIMELKQPGLHFLIDETLDAEISSYFSFSGYPGYAFIDKKGNYKPSALKDISKIANSDALSALIKKY